MTAKGSLFNLIIFGKSFEEVAPFNEFPCNTIIVKSGQEYSLKQHDGTTTITGPKEALFYFLLPRLFSDVPIFVLWGETLFEPDPLLRALLPYTTRLIFKAECVEAARAKEMLALMEALPVELVDINWAKLAGWRSLFGRIFDTKERIRAIMGARRVIIRYSGSKIQSLYVQGWLEAQLGLKGKIELEEAKASKVPAGEIQGIELDLPQDELVKLERSGEELKVQIQITHQEKCDLPFIIPLLDFSRSLTFMKELFYYPFGEHYKNTLKAISHNDV